MSIFLLIFAGIACLNISAIMIFIDMDQKQSRRFHTTMYAFDVAGVAFSVALAWQFCNWLTITIAVVALTISLLCFGYIKMYDRRRG